MKDAELRGRFDSIDARFEKIDARFEQMDRRFEQIDRRFERMLDEFAETRRVLALEIINTREHLTARINGVDQKVEAFRDETHANFDHGFGRFDLLETEYYAISAGLRRVEKRFSEDA